MVQSGLSFAHGASTFQTPHVLDSHRTQRKRYSHNTSLPRSRRNHTRFAEHRQRHGRRYFPGKSDHAPSRVSNEERWKLYAHAGCTHAYADTPVAYANTHKGRTHTYACAAYTYACAHADRAYAYANSHQMLNSYRAVV